VVAGATIHGAAVLIGARAALIRGPSGSGKSRLALALIAAPSGGTPAFTRLVADDRVHVEAHHGRLMARPPPALAGLLEIRGIGIRRLPYEPMAVVSLVVDLDDPAAERLPRPAVATIAGVSVPRLAVAAGHNPFPLVLAAITSAFGLPAGAL
jgi:HPr kinase/phosphorylase